MVDTQQAYRIRNWCRDFEVNDKGSPAKQGQALRKKPLEYIRYPVTGHVLTIIDRKIKDLCWQWGYPASMPAAVTGVYIKVVALAGFAAERESRGWVLDENNLPMTDVQIAELLDWDKETVQKALEVLTAPTIAVLELTEFLPVSPYSPGIPGIPGIPGVLYNKTKTKQNITKHNQTAPISPGGTLDLDLEEYRTPHHAVDRIVVLLTPRTKSEKKTVANICKQINARLAAGDESPNVWPKLVQAAGECRTADKPLAAFVARSKKQFGFKPESVQQPENASEHVKGPP